ncbi:MAG: DNA polymerase III subunit alpha [Polyangiaceae bacterium]|nr:DNA polymerase III subunit alpha [Polyangiaceae bacterium]MCW5791224.1 DNA polymerase III subunit alpha [Polyangiaceae bacterium]
MGFVELLARSNFSFLRGASHPEQLVTRAAELGLEAIAICDWNGLYGAARSFQRGRELGQRVIVGAELSVNPGARGDSAPTGSTLHRSALPNPQKTQREALGRALSAGSLELPTVYCLVEDHRGYTNLCRLLTRGHADQPKGEAAVELSWLLEHAAGLRLVLPVPEQPRPGEPRRVELRPEQLSALAEAYDARASDPEARRIAVAQVRRLDGYDRAREQLGRSLAEEHGFTPIASARPRYHHPSLRRVADVLECVRRKLTLDRAGTWLSVNAEALRSEAAMRARFADEPAWVDATSKFARALSFSLAELDYQFPCALAPGESADQRLWRLTWEGARRRYPEGIPMQVDEQIRKELSLIERMRVAPYFLSTWEVVELARARKILCQGRGSAANSAVCYALGITAVDPARSELLFERFLSEERAEPPDIDIDFEHERREEVIQDIYARYGRGRAAMVSEVIRYRGKSALRDVGRVFGLSLAQVDQLSAALTQWESAAAVPQRLRAHGFDPNDARLSQVVSVAMALEGFPRHLSIHVGGFVLSDAPLDQVAPIEPARMEGRTVIPWDKDDLEILGFFKIDVLGLGMLTAIRKALLLIDEDGGLPACAPDPRAPRLGCGFELPDVEPGVRASAHASPAALMDMITDVWDPLRAITQIPPEDPAVYAMISRADTVGVFQVESRAQRAMLPRLRPRCFYDLVIEVALVRPGPIQGGMVHPYLRRRSGEEAARVPHPALWPILQRTLGVPLFQEQVMQIAITCAGYGAGEADQLRRDMAAWKRSGNLLRHRERLLAGFMARGIDARFGEALFKQIQGFGDYGFPESHAASFALIVYASAWQKAYFPAHFACALLNSQPLGFYSVASIVRDAAEHGVEVRDVCALRSQWDSSLEWADEAPGGASVDRVSGADEIARRIPGVGGWVTSPRGGRRRRALRLGLRLIRGLGEGSAERIAQARAEAPPRSIEELTRRARLTRRELDALARAGALTALEPERRQALWRASAPSHGRLFAALDVREPSVPLPPLKRAEQLLLDYHSKSLCLTDHPMSHLRQRLAQEGVLSSAQLADAASGRQVSVAGLVLSRQRPATASGVVFMTLEDELGCVQLVIYTRVFERFQRVARSAMLVLAHGRLERQVAPRLPLSSSPHAASLAVEEAPVPVLHVVVTHLARLEPPGELGVRSRDFH